LQKRPAIVSGLLFTMKIPTTACGGANDRRGPGGCDRRWIHLGNTAARSFAPCNLLS
jgi:hypothetical protein